MEGAIALDPSLPCDPARDLRPAVATQWLPVLKHHAALSPPQTLVAEHRFNPHIAACFGGHRWPLQQKWVPAKTSRRAATVRAGVSFRLITIRRRSTHRTATQPLSVRYPRA